MKTLNKTISCGLFRLITFIQHYKSQYIISLFTLGYLGLLIRFLSGYFIIDFIVLGALLISPYIIKPNNTKKGSLKYLGLSFIFMLLTFLSGVQTFYFFALGTALLFIIESTAGYIDHLPFFLLGLLSPTFKYFNTMLGFPVRLQISIWTGKILQFLGYKIEIMGNVIVLNGTEFSVDPACVGLKMMAASILAGLIIMAFFQQQRGKPFSFLIASMIFLSIIGLNIISNLIRILILTIFKILPDNPNHDMVGIICFLMYIILPSYFLIKWAAGNSSGNKKMPYYQHNKSGKILFLNMMLFIAVAMTGLTKINPKENFTATTPSITLKGYSKQLVNGGITKLEKPGILIYIKPMQHFYGAEHNPMICWIGSGYQFSRINKEKIEGKEFFTGILKKGNDIIYSAWWFDDGTYRTSGQIDWRWRALKGDHFYLVNINSGDENTLKNEVKKLLKNRSTKSILALASRSTSNKPCDFIEHNC